MEKNKLGFEEALKRLEEIARDLESSEISLDDSISLFEEGVKLSKYCSDILDTAKQKIEKLDENGEIRND
jgi:exodeoxyribonuclease VII small subunit